MPRQEQSGLRTWLGELGLPASPLEHSPEVDLDSSVQFPSLCLLNTGCANRFLPATGEHVLLWEAGVEPPLARSQLSARVDKFRVVGAVDTEARQQLHRRMASAAAEAAERQRAAKRRNSSRLVQLFTTDTSVKEAQQAAAVVGLRVAARVDERWQPATVVSSGRGTSGPFLSCALDSSGEGQVPYRVADNGRECFRLDQQPQQVDHLQGPMWQWLRQPNAAREAEGAAGSESEWVAFEPSESEVLEAALKGQSHGAAITSGAGQLFVIDFRAMVRREEQSGEEWPIRRLGGVDGRSSPLQLRPPTRQSGAEEQRRSLTTDDDDDNADDDSTFMEPLEDEDTQRALSSPSPEPELLVRQTSGLRRQLPLQPTIEVSLWRLSVGVPQQSSPMPLSPRGNIADDATSPSTEGTAGTDQARHVRELRDDTCTIFQCIMDAHADADLSHNEGAHSLSPWQNTYTLQFEVCVDDPYAIPNTLRDEECSSKLVVEPELESEPEVDLPICPWFTVGTSVLQPSINGIFCPRQRSNKDLETEAPTVLYERFQDESSMGTTSSLLRSVALLRQQPGSLVLYWQPAHGGEWCIADSVGVGFRAVCRCGTAGDFGDGQGEEGACATPAKVPPQEGWMVWDGAHTNTKS